MIDAVDMYIKEEDYLNIYLINYNIINRVRSIDHDPLITPRPQQIA